MMGVFVWKMNGCVTKLLTIVVKGSEEMSESLRQARQGKIAEESKECDISEQRLSTA